MKITITYSYDPNCTSYPFWAATKVKGISIGRCGVSAEYAKSSLIAAVKAYLEPGPYVPPPEEVEISSITKPEPQSSSYQIVNTKYLDRYHEFVRLWEQWKRD